MQNRATTWLLSMIVLAALALFWLFDNSGASRLPTMAAGAGERGRPELGRDPVELAKGDAFPSLSAEDSREQLLDAALTGPILRIVDAATGQPVPGAEVRLVESRVARQKARDQGRQVRSRYEYLPLYGIRRTSDDFGEVRLPVPEGRLLVSAAAGDLYGVASLEGEQPDSLDLLLLPDHDLTIEVIDGSGVPVVGVPLGIGPQLAGRRKVIWSGTSGESGKVRIEHLQVFMPGLAMTTQLQVDFLFPQLHPLGIPFVLEPVPLQNLTVTLPATGSAELTLQHQDQALVLSPAQVSLQIVNRGAHSGTRVHPLQIRITGNKVAGTAPIVIPFLGLGMQFQVEVRAKPLRFNKRRLSGPNAPGQRVHVTLEVDRAVAALVGRAVDERGLVLADREIDLAFVWGEVIARRMQVRSDAQGRFEYAVALRRRQPDALYCELRSHRREAGLSTRVELPGSRWRGRLDLGDVVLRSPAAYARGTVIDDLGDTVGDLRAWVEKLVPPTGKAPGPTWLRDLEMPIVHAEDGLQIRGDGQGERRLRVTSATHLPIDPMPLHRGQEFELMLTRGANIEGLLLLDPWVESAAIEVRVRASTAAGLQAEQGIRGRGERRTFNFRALPQGSLGLQVILRSENRELYRLHELQAQVGEQLQDPRLRVIDLRGRLNRVSIELRNASGSRPRRKAAMLLVEPMRVGELRQSYDLSRGRIDIATLRPSLDLTVLVPGFEPKVISQAAGVMQVDLRRATAQRIELQGDSLPVSPPFSMRITLLPDPPLAYVGRVADAYSGRAHKLDLRPFGLQPTGKVNRLGRFQFKNLSSGRYRVRLDVSERGDRRPRRIDLPSVEIAGGIRQPLVIPIPADLLKEVRESFK